MKEAVHTGWIRPLTRGAGPRYLQIADLIGQAVQAGTLAAGDQIPPQRWLASRLGVDLTTVTRAYTEARNRGLIASFSGRGSFIAGQAAPAGRERIDLTMNIPPQPAGGGMAARVQAGIAEVLERQGIEALSRYQDDAAGSSAAQAGQAWLRPALGALAGQAPILCAGSQAGLFGVLMSAARRGEAVLCEPLTYPGFLLAVRQLGLRAVGVASDAEGVVPDAIERCHRETGARLIYLNPTLQNPTAQTMPEGRRKDVAAVLQRLGMTLVEDDPYRYLLNDAPPPLATLTGGERTYYLASLSKCVWPSLRTSFLLPPRGESSIPLQESLRACSMGCSGLLTALSEQWIRSGVARQLSLEVQREARARQTLARSILPKAAQAHPSGIHVWLPLPAHWNQHLFVHALEQQGILVASADSFGVEAESGDAVRISIGGAASQAELARALQQIAALLEEDRRRSSRAIV
ncbi:PLP-dependent aminotransferase family protein [Pigmentiphaga soli]|uniref:PLP-dependent aminotransferase family protein n=2 Tax=Pigmentiphaga soli TaxID=1007095 RepID=A0ABP8GJI0_9BURK